jgi:quinoprotein glucose dehydrogenase
MRDKVRFCRPLVQRSMKSAFPLAALCLSAVGLGWVPNGRAASPASDNQDWPAYGGGPKEIRYSHLTDINQGNVSQLQVAWTYDTDDGLGASETQPIVVNGVLFGLTPRHRVIALDGATGKLLWKFDSGVTGHGANRGLVYWSDGDDQRIFAGVQSFLYALNARTGTIIRSFGKEGRIDLREGLGREPEKQSIVLTTPGIIYKDTLIVGGRDPEKLPSPPGDIRAFDVRTGQVRWTFHTIPRPGEYGYDTWPKDAWKQSGSANNWAGMALDESRGIVYIPTGSAATDFYGADRLGDDLFANCLLALDANTGKRIWHFQGVKHDIWDRDFPSPPSLVTVKQNGKDVDAIAQTSKQGWVYLFDRVTGAPLFPLQSREYPSSDVPGEVASKTQSLPTKPQPFARQRLTEDLLTNRTPAAHQWAQEKFRTFRSNGQFVPLATGQETVIFPGFDGGAEWGGSAFDPETGLLYVNANDLAWTGGLTENGGASSPGQKVYLSNCAPCHGDNRAGAPPQIPSLVEIGSRRSPEQIRTLVRQGAGRMPSFPNIGPSEMDALLAYLTGGEDKELASKETPAVEEKYRFTGYHRFVDPDGYPAVAPPWGTLSAINLSTGEYAWKIPLGEYPELAAQGMRNTGTENYGGPVVTAGGLVFIGATNYDDKFHAFDKRTGRLLWEAKLPLAGNATPITYKINGRQYVVIYAAGGFARRATIPATAVPPGGMQAGGHQPAGVPPAAAPSEAAPEVPKSGGIYVAFALPDKSAPGASNKR